MNKFDYKSTVRRQRLANHDLTENEQIKIVSAMQLIAMNIASGDIDENDIKEDITAIINAEIDWFKEEYKNAKS